MGKYQSMGGNGMAEKKTERSLIANVQLVTSNNFFGKVSNINMYVG
jgi:hypothetical protein